MSLPDQPAGLCERCRQHQATEIRADSVLDYAHGHYRNFCACCSVAEAIQHVEDGMAKLPELRVLLESACSGEPVRDVQGLLTENDKLRTELGHQWEMAHVMVCGKRNTTIAFGDPDPHRDGSHCYYPKPEVLNGTD